MTKYKQVKKRAAQISKTILTFLASKRFLYIILTWFVLQAGFMALSTKKGIPPDEGNHYRSIIMFAEAGPGSFLKLNHPEAWRLQGASRTPNYAYHYLMSYPYRLLPNSWSDEQKVVALRFTSIVLSLGGLIILARAFDLVTKNGWVRNMSLVMLTNTIMLPFIGGSINYDNLAFLVSAALLFYFIRLIQKFQLADLMIFVSLCCFGALVKFQLIVLVGMMGLLLLVHYRRDCKKLWQQSLNQMKTERRKLLWLLVPFVIFLGLFIERYGVNFVRYGTYKPQCDQVLPYDECLKSGLFIRNLSFRHNPVKRPIPSPGYIFGWTGAMKKNVYSIVGHKRTYETPVVAYGVTVIWILMTAAVAIKFDKKNKVLIYMLIIALIYCSALLLFNYLLFAKSGKNLARQGRYLFPVLGTLYFIGMYYVARVIGKRSVIQTAASFIIIVIFFISSLPSYIYQTNLSWNSQTMRGINQRIRAPLRKVF